MTTGGRPRVLHVIGSLDIGGAERQIVEIVRGLAHRFEFHVGLLASGGPLEPMVRAAGGEIHLLSSRASTRHPARRAWRVFRARSRMRSLLRDLEPALLHSWLFETSFLAAASRWPRRSPPLIVSRRSLVEWIARHRGYYPLARWTNRQADLLLANSEAVRREVVQKEGVGAGRIELIYNGVDTSLYAPGPPDEELRRELGLPSGLPVVGVVANLQPYKGHAEVVEAAAMLGAQGRRFALLFVGRDSGTAATLRKQVERLGLENVLFAGPRGDVPRVLRLMDVFVSASHEEGLSNAILEAMATGCAIVTTSVGGSVEQVEHGRSGLVVPPRSPAELAAAMGRLLDEPALRERFGLAARADATRRFSNAAMLANVEAVYRRLLASP